jgi:hypothetical protein
MRRIAAKFVPLLLQNEQKHHHLEGCGELQQQLQEDPDFLLKCVRFEVFTTVTMKNDVFWDVTPCGSCKDRSFGGT